MLVLSRKPFEKIVINGNIVITVMGPGNSRVRIGIDAPNSVGIVREELIDRAGASEKQSEARPVELGNKSSLR